MNVGPTFINFGFFSMPYGLIKGPTNIYKFDVCFFNMTLYILFKALHLLFLANFLGPMFIICPTFIQDSGVHI